MFNDLWEYFKAISEVDNIWWMHNNHKVFKLPLITLQVISITNNNPSTTLADTSDEVTLYTDAEMTLSINIYTDGAPYKALNDINVIRKKMLLPTGKQYLRGLGFALIDIEMMELMPVLSNERWESRATMDIRLRALEDVTEATESIEHIQYTGQYNTDYGIPQEV